MELTRHIHSRILSRNQLKIEDCSRVTHAFSSHVEVLALQLFEHFQELLHEANELGGQIVLILSRYECLWHPNEVVRTVMLGTP